MSSTPKKACILLADGCEEVEALTIVDVLRRGGIHVTLASLSDRLTIQGAHGITFQADAPLATLRAGDFALAVCPGGMGCMTALRASAPAHAFLRAAAAAGALVGAICASPVALGAAGLLAGKRFCCYPGMQNQIEGGHYDPTAHVVRDGLILTGTGPATAMEYALALLEALTDAPTATRIAHGLLFS